MRMGRPYTNPNYKSGSPHTRGLTSESQQPAPLPCETLVTAAQRFLTWDNAAVIVRLLHLTTHVPSHNHGSVEPKLPMKGNSSHIFQWLPPGPSTSIKSWEETDFQFTNVFPMVDGNLILQVYRWNLPGNKLSKEERPRSQPFQWFLLILSIKSIKEDWIPNNFFLSPRIFLGVSKLQCH